ncbi:MAG TPA: hypothetical protein VFZ79_07135 [Acidimicrobiales bacterium]
MEGDVLATVAWEAGAAFVTAARPRLRFGRSTQCELRFGHQPLADLSVPRVAGAVVAVDGRVGVDNLSDKVAFDVKTADGPLETVRPGGLVAPAGDRFEIVFVGSLDTHVIAVHRQTEPRRLGIEPPVPDDEPPTMLEPQLTARQWQILEAYTEPLRSGATTPATHAQVAARVHWGYSLVRRECHAIWAAFRMAGVPVRAFPDRRDAVVDAAIRHRLRAPGDLPSDRA